MKTRVINERILSGSFNEQEIESIIDAITQEKKRQAYVKTLQVGDPVLYKNYRTNSTEIGRIVEVNTRRNYFLTDVKRKVRTVRHAAWFKDVILPKLDN
jgi:hypothetical protein